MADQAERVVLEAEDQVNPVVDKANAGLDSFGNAQYHTNRAARYPRVLLGAAGEQEENRPELWRRRTVRKPDPFRPDLSVAQSLSG